MQQRTHVLVCEGEPLLPLTSPHTWFNALLPGRSPLHTVFDTVVEFTTLERERTCRGWNHCFQQQQRGALPDLFGIELVELRLLAVAPPQTQHLGLGAVGHVDELLVPPALVDRADVATQHYAVIAHLKGDFFFIFRNLSE